MTDDCKKRLANARAKARRKGLVIVFDRHLGMLGNRYQLRNMYSDRLVFGTPCLDDLYRFLRDKVE